MGKCVIENVSAAQSHCVKDMRECLVPLMAKPLEHHGCLFISGCLRGHLTKSGCPKCIRAGRRVMSFIVMSFLVNISEQIFIYLFLSKEGVSEVAIIDIFMAFLIPVYVFRTELCYNRDSRLFATEVKFTLGHKPAWQNCPSKSKI